LLLGVERACDLIVEQLFGLDDARWPLQSFSGKLRRT
jgi:hypothetical protein